MGTLKRARPAGAAAKSGGRENGLEKSRPMIYGLMSGIACDYVRPMTVKPVRIDPEHGRTGLERG